MTFIPTTATLTEKLKRLAKNQRKGTDSSLALALDSVAQSNGYLNWKHVTECLRMSKTAPIGRQPLPRILQSFLSEHAMNNPLAADTRQAFQSGLVFSMDIKEAERMQLNDDIIECSDAWIAAAADIWAVMVHNKDPEDEKSLAERLDDDDLLDTATDNLGNFRHFRYCGSHAPATLESAYALVMSHSFFSPMFLWVNGRFFDKGGVSELRVEGRVVYSSN